MNLRSPEPHSASTHHDDAMVHLVVVITLGLLACLISECHAVHGSWGRGERKPFDPPFRVPYNLGGKLCTKDKDTAACTAAAFYLGSAYYVQFNVAHCAKRWTNGRHRRQCHLKYKPSKTTDLECWVFDGSAGPMAECRRPWDKPLVESQRMTRYGNQLPPSPAFQGGYYGY